MNCDYSYKDALKILLKAPGSKFKVVFENERSENIVHIPTGLYFYTGLSIIVIHQGGREYEASMFQWTLNKLFSNEKKIIDRIRAYREGN